MTWHLHNSTPEAVNSPQTKVSPEKVGLHKKATTVA